MRAKIGKIKIRREKNNVFHQITRRWMSKFAVFIIKFQSFIVISYFGKQQKTLLLYGLNLHQ